MLSIASHSIDIFLEISQAVSVEYASQLIKLYYAKHFGQFCHPQAYLKIVAVSTHR